MLNLVKNVYFPNRNGNNVQKPFQKGIIVSIKSTIQMFSELKSEGISFLLTSRVNQDCLENMFTQIRQMGGPNSHPTSVELINRVRKLCLTKNVNVIVSGTCVEQYNDCDFISAKILDTIDVEIKEDEFICKDIDDELSIVVDEI